MTEFPTFDGALEIRARGSGRVLSGRFPYSPGPGRMMATISDRGKRRKERIADDAFGWQIRAFAEVQQELARVIELHDKADSATPEEKIELAQEVFRMQADNLWTIGTVGNTPAVLGIAVVNNDFRNVPGNQPHQWWYIFRPEQFFFR